MRAALVLLLLLIHGVALADARPDRTGEVRAAVDTFLHAFEALDWPAFRSCFAEGATVFHPAPPNVMRTDSPESFERAWAVVFERIRRNSGRTAPPYFTLSPTDMRIQLLTDRTALVTFHLPQGETLGRRTLILERLAAGWKIIHLHASNVGSPAPAGGASPRGSAPATEAPGAAKANDPAPATRETGQ